MNTMTYKTSPNYILRQIAGANVLVSIGSGVADFCGYINMNDTAVTIWKALQQGASSQQLAEALTAEYDVSKEQAQSDVDTVLSMLLEKGMVIRG